jgi:CRISPR-associated endonuclease Csn1
MVPQMSLRVKKGYLPFNKVLVKTDENQRKGNQTVWEYFNERKSSEDWDRLVHAVKYLPSQKRNNILNQTFARNEEDWKERHLNDTRWITRAVKTHIEQHLNLPGELGKKQTVLAVNGSVTHYLRLQWGLEKNREESSKHHAQDAAVIAAATPAIIQKVANYNKYLRKAKGEMVHTPAPWESFRRDVKNRLDEIFVSRMPRRAVSGEIASPNPSRVIMHPETGKQIVIERVGLDSLDNKKLERLIGKEARNKKLYGILLARLQEHGGKPDKAFKEPVYLDKNERQHQVKKVSLYGSPESGKLIRGGLVSNGAQVRVDVFCKRDEFYLCPVYAWHFKIGQTPNQVIKPKKKIEEWPIINEAFQFQFTLYPNDFVRLTQKNGQVFEGYYVTTDIALGQISLRSHDDSDIYPQKDTLVNVRSFGVMSLKLMEKYQVDYFGNKFPVQEKERPPIKKKRSKCLDVAHSAHSEQLQAQSKKPAIEAEE